MFPELFCECGEKAVDYLKSPQLRVFLTDHFILGSYVSKDYNHVVWRWWC